MSAATKKEKRFLLLVDDDAQAINNVKDRAVALQEETLRLRKAVAEKKVELASSQKLLKQLTRSEADMRKRLNALELKQKRDPDVDARIRTLRDQLVTCKAKKNWRSETQSPT